MNLPLICFLTYVTSVILYWIFMLVRMPKMKFPSWKYRLGFSALVLKVAALWPVSLGIKLWDRLRKRD